MLRQLRVKDFAIIRELDLELSRGLMILTGETGAGKSIMIDAVELLIGGRADSAVVRSGTEIAMLEAVFGLDPAVRPALIDILRREELLDDGSADEIVVSREIRMEGRNVCRVNGRIVPLALLREIGDLLVDVHGQSEHLSLLRVRHHLSLLDRYANVGPELEAYQSAYESLEKVRKELKTLRGRERDSSQRADFLAFQMDEITTAKLKAGEERDLKGEQARLANAEALTRLSETALATLEEGLHGEISAGDLLAQAVEAIGELAELDPDLEGWRDESQALLEQVSDLARRLRLYGEGLEFNPSRLDEVEERLSLIQDLKRKYGGSIEEIQAYAEKARVELDGITHAEDRSEELQAAEERLLIELGRLGAELSHRRLDAAQSLADEVERELEDLNMAGARFEVGHEWIESEDGAPVDDRRIAFGAAGLDRVEFLVAPNPGEGLKPLVKVASGGETSRLMLALKGVLAEADDTPTLIFDEIDQGIGGRVGAIVGAKLWDLARTHQVLCITHLPQLAAHGDRHFRVEKRVDQGRTETEVQPVGGHDRVGELAQMLGGATDPNLETASALLQEAEAGRSSAKPGRYLR
ncbi:MAG: DNA repair protein RecN [Anaerolineales bacterium]